MRRRDLIREARQRGFITRSAALRGVAEHVLDDAVADGVLVRLFPEVYTLPHNVDDLRIRRRAALSYLRDGALSHLDALDVWGLLPGPVGPGSPIHVTTDRSVPFSGWPQVEHHRRRGFVLDSPSVVVRSGIRVVRIEQAIVESWRLIPEIDRRVPVIVAMRERRTTAGRLMHALAANPRAAGAAEMRHVFGLAAAGCHSPLEMWGHEKVFSHPSLPTSQGQVPVRLPSGVIYLDRYYDAEKLAVELDGAAYHGEPGQREADLRRDAALAAIGIQTVRFSHPRLFGNPNEVRRQTLAILTMRRRQFGLPTAS